MVTKTSHKSNGQIFSVTEVEKRSMEFITEPSDSGNFMRNNSYAKLRCIHRNIRTERAIETVGKKGDTLQDLAVAQPFIDKLLSSASRKQLQIQNTDAEHQISRRIEFVAGCMRWRWWSLPFILLLLSGFFFIKRASVTKYIAIVKDQLEDPEIVLNYPDDEHSLELKEVRNDVEKRLSMVISGVEKEMENFFAVRSSLLLRRVEERMNELNEVLRDIQENFIELHEKYKFLEKSCRKDHVESLIRSAFEIYDADKTGLHDFAAESAGGTVILERTSATYTPYWFNFFCFSFPLNRKSPISVIQRKLGFGPGECWPFEGSAGVLTIRLSQRANVTAVSYEHVSAKLNPDGNIRSAPKNFQIWAYDDVDEKQTRKMLGEYIYLDRGPALQFFETQIFIPPVAVRFVEFRILSNYGSPYTCLYRFRVHGLKADLAETEHAI